MTAATDTRPADAPIPAHEVPRGTEAVERDIPLELIDTADNVRTAIDPEVDATLAASIKAHGLLQPIAVEAQPDGRFRVRYGHTRLRAVRLLGHATIRARVLTDADESTRRIEQLIENVHRHDLNPLDEAHALEAILASGMSRKELAAELRCEESTISNKVRVLKLPAEVKRIMAAGQLTGSAAEPLITLPRELQIEVAENAARTGMSSREVAAEARFAKQRLQQREQEAERAAHRWDGLVPALEAKGAKLDQAVRVTGYNGTGDAIAHLRAAGWTDVAEADDNAWQERPRAQYCTCVAWRVSVGYGTEVKATCIDRAHRKAQDAADAKVRNEESAAKKRAVEAVAAAVRADMAAAPLPTLALRILFGRQLGYRSAEWAKGREGAGKGKKPDVWGAICAVPHEELLTAVAAHIAGMAEYSSDGITPERIAAALASPGTPA